MKTGRRNLRKMILEIICEGDVVYPNFPDHRKKEKYDQDETWYDLLDDEERESLRSLRGQLRMLRSQEDRLLRDIMSQSKEDDRKYGDDDDEEFERYIAGTELSNSGKAGQLIDLLDGYGDDDLSENKDGGMYPAELGIKTPTGPTPTSASATSTAKTDVGAEEVETTQELDSKDMRKTDSLHQAKRKVLNQQLDALTAKQAQQNPTA